MGAWAWGGRLRWLATPRSRSGGGGSGATCAACGRAARCLVLDSSWLAGGAVQQRARPSRPAGGAGQRGGARGKAVGTHPDRAPSGTSGHRLTCAQLPLMALCALFWVPKYKHLKLRACRQTQERGFWRGRRRAAGSRANGCWPLATCVLFHLPCRCAHAPGLRSLAAHPWSQIRWPWLPNAVRKETSGPAEPAVDVKGCWRQRMQG